jgi:hypothetical protein
MIMKTLSGMVRAYRARRLEILAAGLQDRADAYRRAACRLADDFAKLNRPSPEFADMISADIHALGQTARRLDSQARGRVRYARLIRAA